MAQTKKKHVSLVGGSSTPSKRRATKSKSRSRGRTAIKRTTASKYTRSKRRGRG